MNVQEQVDLRRVATFLEYRLKKPFDEAPIYYNELADELGFPAVDQNWFAHPFCKIFELLDIEDAKNKRPLRTSLVIGRESNMPGPGFFKVVSKLRNTRTAASFAEKSKLWADELQSLLDYYNKPKTKNL